MERELYKFVSKISIHEDHDTFTSVESKLQSSCPLAKEKTGNKPSGVCNDASSCVFPHDFL